MYVYIYIYCNYVHICRRISHDHSMPIISDPHPKLLRYLLSIAGSQASYVFQFCRLHLRRLATQQIDQQRCELWLLSPIIEPVQCWRRWLSLVDTFRSISDSSNIIKPTILCRFPEIWVPPNHPFLVLFSIIFSIINQPAIGVPRMVMESSICWGITTPNSARLLDGASFTHEAALPQAARKMLPLRPGLQPTAPLYRYRCIDAN